MSNHDLEQVVDADNEWIISRTAIRERRIASEGETTATLATEASIRALGDAGMSPDDIDLIILATSSPDMPGYPSTACLVQNALGLSGRFVPAFDLVAACSGFGYGLNVASQFVRTGFYKNILVIGAETNSRILDYTDRTTCILFGDGAGACVVGPTKGKHEIIDGYMAADGSGALMLRIPAGGSKMPASHNTVDEHLHSIKMEGRPVFKFAVNAMNGMIEDILKKHQLTPDDIGIVIPHQANFRITEAVSERTCIPQERIYMNLDRYGNTSAASVPIAFREAIDEGKVPDGKYVIIAAFGGGLTKTSVLIKW